MSYSIEQIERAIEKRREWIDLTPDERRLNSNLLIDSIPWLLGNLVAYKAVIEKINISLVANEIQS